jgi:hypothetical protein
MQKRVLIIAKIAVPISVLLILGQMFYVEEYDGGNSAYGGCSAKMGFVDRLIAKSYFKASLSLLYIKNAKCAPGNLKPEKVIQIEDLNPKNAQFEDFLIKIDPEYIIQRESLSITDKSILKCTLELFDKQLNKSEGYSNLWYKNVSAVEVNLKNDQTLQFRVNLSGFYFIKCLYSSDSKTFKQVYTEVFSILPSSIKTLVERNKASRKETEDLREKYASLDSKTNPMLTDLKFEECEKLEGGELEDKMNVIVIGLDSVSYPNLKRIFPLTYKYLLEESENNFIFENLNIVGENTYPNMLPLFSGVIKESNSEIDIKDETRFFSDRLNESSFHDLMPFLWYEFEKLGYATMYREDQPNLSTFGFAKNGFRYK